MSLFMKKLLAVSGKKKKKALDYKLNMVSNLPNGEDWHH